MDKPPLTPKQQRTLLIISGLILLAGFVIMFIGDDVVDKEKFGESIKILGILIAVSPLIPLYILYPRIVKKEKQDRKDRIEKNLHIQKTACDLSLLSAAAAKQGFKKTNDESTDSNSNIEFYYKKQYFGKPNEMILIQNDASLNDIEKLRDLFVVEQINVKTNYTKLDKKSGTLCMAVLVMQTLEQETENKFLEMSKEYIYESIDREDETFHFDENYTPPLPPTFVPFIVNKEKGELICAYSNVTNKLGKKTFVKN